MNIFLRASCGCIVLNMQPLGTYRIVVDPCDGENAGLTFFPHQMNGRTYEPLGAEEQAVYRRRMADAMCDASALRTLKAILKQ